jgi:hypothetical protein
MLTAQKVAIVAAPTAFAVPPCAVSGASVAYARPLA